jgi:hypothetical protein
MVVARTDTASGGVVCVCKKRLEIRSGAGLETETILSRSRLPLTILDQRQPALLNLYVGI